jgi:PAS domain S-box-containing protein
MDGFRRSWVIGAIAMVAIGVAGWITLDKVRTLEASTDWVRHSQDVRLALEHALSTLKDVETNTRGYIVARDGTFLPRYESSLRELDVDLAALRRLVADSPAQSARVQELERRMRVRLAPLQGAVDSARRSGPERVRDEIVRVQLAGDSLMQAVREQVRVIHADEAQRLQSRLRDAADAHRTTVLSAGGTTAFAIVLVLVVLVLDARATSRLRQSEEWLGTTLRSIGDAVIATDEQGRVKYLNPVASELTGWSTDEARMRRLEEVFNIVAEDSGVAAESPVTRVLREGVVVGLANHTLLVRRDGTRIPIEDSGAPIKGEHGAVHGVVMVFKDASVQRAAEAALTASEERLRLAIEGAELGTWEFDLTTQKLTWNAQLYRIMGFDENTPLTRELSRAHIAPEDREHVIAVNEGAKKSREPYHLEYRIVRADDGAERWVSVVGRYIFDEDGEPVRRLGVVIDVTERKKLEQRVRQAQKLDALGTLAGGIAHDFNNILSILRGNLLLIEADLEPGHPIAPAISEMSRACARARDLVRQILTFGRQQEQDRKIIGLIDVIDEALKLLRSTVPTTIEIRSRFAENLPTVLADSGQIHQVVMNLGINASQAIGRATGVITAELDEVHIDAALAQHSPDLHEGSYVRLRFGDNGAGMSSDVLERIFEPFFTTKPQGSGTGLGLAVVRGIIKTHDGAVTVYSKPGKGTQFNLYFPVVEGVAAEVPRPAPAPIEGRGQRILYLDDEESLVVLARRLLERLGYRVAGYSDAAEALAAFEAAPDQFDLVLSDLSMPGINGIEVARRVLEIRPDMPVLLASGYVRNEDAELARSVGVREVIWKPTTINEMGELLGRVLEKIIPRQ